MGLFSSPKKQGRRLINFDSSFYGARFLPQGFRQAAQFLTSPAALTSMAVNFSVAIHEVCTEKTHGVLLNPAVLQALMPIVGYSVNKLYLRDLANSAPSESAAIDKSGHIASGADQAGKAVQKLQKLGMANRNVAIASGIIPALFYGMPTLSNSALLTPFVCYAVWNYHAAHKIEKGDWTIHADPPGKPKRAHNKLSLGRFARLNR